MPNITASLVIGDSDQFVTLYVEGADQPLVPIPQSHPHFDTIKAEVQDAADENRPVSEDILPLLDIAQTVTDEFQRLSRRFSVENGTILFDHDPVDNTLAEHILRLLNAGEGFESVVNFAEKLYANPGLIEVDEDGAYAESDTIVSQVFNWLRAEGLATFTSQGNIVGYKGVTRDSEGNLTSINRGEAIVDGQKVNGAVPYAPGSVVEMPRSAVEADPSVGCSTGLHVGTYEYASGFGYSDAPLLEVEVDPTDIVSVPYECSAQKMRVSRLTVVGEVERKYDTPVRPEVEAEVSADLDDDDWL